MITEPAKNDVGLRGRLNVLRGGLDGFPTSLLKLMARVAAAVVFFKSGEIKLADWAVTLELFAGDYHVPFLAPNVAAVIAATIELGGSTMLFFGVFARIGATALLGLIIVVQLFVYPENWSDHLVWGTLLTYVLTRGPGPFAIDHIIARKWLDRR